MHPLCLLVKVLMYVPPLATRLSLVALIGRLSNKVESHWCSCNPLLVLILSVAAGMPAAAGMRSREHHHTWKSCRARQAA